jgi:hypothetical protein
MDSDFKCLYEETGGFYWAKNRTFDANADFSAGKTNLGYAVISNCKAVSGRSAYINEMQSHGAQIDVYGKCGQPCPAKAGRKDVWESEDCKELLAAKYKFFLAFENSHCIDYISEKFFSVLKYNVVPVVRGAGNYSYFVPKSGYINSLDFKSPKHLVEYLIYLDSNRTAYNDYFKWKRHVTFHEKIITNSINVMCDICIRLHMDDQFGVKRQVLGNLSNYWKC